MVLFHLYAGFYDANRLSQLDELVRIYVVYSKCHCMKLLLLTLNIWSPYIPISSNLIMLSTKIRMWKLYVLTFSIECENYISNGGVSSGKLLQKQELSVKSDR